MKSLVIVGSGGHGKVVANAAEKEGNWKIRGWLDDTKPAGTEVYGYPVLGSLAEVKTVIDLNSDQIVIAIGDNEARARIAEQLAAAGAIFATIIHPSAEIARGASIGKGSMVLAHATVNADARVGEHVILNSHSVVEHDCEVGRCAHVASLAGMSGAASVGARALVGTGAKVLPKIHIGERCIVGAGAIVVEHVDVDTTVVGIPAKPIKR